MELTHAGLILEIVGGMLVTLDLLGPSTERFERRVLDFVGQLRPGNLHKRLARRDSRALPAVFDGLFLACLVGLLAIIFTGAHVPDRLGWTPVAAPLLLPVASAIVLLLLPLPLILFLSPLHFSRAMKTRYGVRSPLAILGVPLVIGGLFLQLAGTL